jgi:recombination protein RecR
LKGPEYPFTVTSPTVEGEATAVYLADLLRSAAVRVTRIATGVPAGSDIEYADEVTMMILFLFIR